MLFRSPGYIPVLSGENEYQDEIICPIISGGDVMGAILFLNHRGNKAFGEVEQKVALAAADFLGRQMEA